MALKSDGKQFLLNIKPKYRKTVSPILQILKENREASDYVCQAILEKVAREGGLASLTSEVEVLLGENTEIQQVSPIKSHTSIKKVQQQIASTVEEEHEEVEIVESGNEEEITPSVSNDVTADEDVVNQEDSNENSVTELEEVKEKESVTPINKKEDKAKPDTFSSPSVKESRQVDDIKVTVGGKELEPKSGGFGSRMFDEF